MPVRLCSYPKSGSDADAQPCRAPALRGARLCRHHVRQAARDHRRQLALNRGRTVCLGPLSTLAEVQRAINRILSPLAAGTLSLDRAGRYLCRIQLALADIHRRERFALHLTETFEADDSEAGIPVVDIGLPFAPPLRLSGEMLEIWQDAWRTVQSTGPPR